jgi:hypothetical protein
MNLVEPVVENSSNGLRVLTAEKLHKRYARLLAENKVPPEDLAKHNIINCVQK